MKYKDYSKEKLTEEELRKILKENTRIGSLTYEDVVYLEKNANIMDDATMNLLIDNIKRDGRLTQLPFVHRLPSGKYEIISGNHRVEAAEKAGLKEFDAIICEVTLPNDEKLRLQISHNSIRGRQSGLVLLDLSKDIKDSEAFRLAGVDLEMQKLGVEKFEHISIDASAMEFRVLNLFFTKYELEYLDKTLALIDTQVSSNDSYILEVKNYNAFVEAITSAKRDCNIKSNAVVLNLIIQYVNDNLDSLIWYINGKQDQDKTK
jgi:hypothetical protein